MEKEEIQKVLCAFYYPHDKDNPGHPKLWRAAPIEALNKVLAKKNVKWNDEQIKLVGMVLAHPSGAYTLELVRNVFDAEDMIRDAIDQVKPAYWSMLLMHNVTFYLGVILILAAIYSSYEGRDLFSAIFGGVGLGTIVFLFFRQPIRGLQRSISNLIQLEVIYNSYAKQMGYWKAYEKNMHVAVKKEVIHEIEMCTQRTIHLIQKYCERIEFRKV
jgi:hypothetical protein